MVCCVVGDVGGCVDDGVCCVVRVKWEVVWDNELCSWCGVGGCEVGGWWMW